MNQLGAFLSHIRDLPKMDEIIRIELGYESDEIEESSVLPESMESTVKTA